MKKNLLFLILLLSLCACQNRHFRFAVLSDLHVRGDDSMAYNDLKLAVEQINATPGIDFVLAAGDLTENGDKASLLRVKELLDRLEVKHYVLTGNHDTKWSESGATDFGNIFGPDRFSFQHGGYRFLGFGTGPVIRMMDGHVAPQDITWMGEILAADPSRPTFLVTHYPLLPGDVDNWYEATDAVREYDIKAVIGGHYHRDSLLRYDGIPSFLCRSTLRDRDGRGGYAEFEITGDSVIAYTRKIGGEARRYGAYSLKEKYYTADNSPYPRPDYSDNTAYPDVKEVWTARTDYAIYASPLLYDNKVYVGDDGGNFLCCSAADDRLMWRFAAGNRIVGTADAADGIVVFGSADGNIYALDAASGDTIWKYGAEAPVLGSARIEDGIVYIGASDRKFRALELKTGLLLWEYEGVEGYIETRPLVYGDKVFFGAWDCNMYALDKQTGSLAWKWDGGHTRMHYSPAAVWPVATGGRVFFTAPDRVMTALDATTGNTVWRLKGPTVRETIALSEDEKRLYSKTMQDSVVCYSAISDKPVRIWATDVAYGYDHAASMPVEKEGTVFGSTKNGVVFALDGKSGKLLWKHKIGNSLIGTVCPVSEKECIFTSSEGIIGLLRYK